MNNHTGMCIYCKESNDFNTEHVISAGLGGDDNNYKLDGLVCFECNSKLFSGLEATLLRHSLVGLARWHNQPKGRGKSFSRYSANGSVLIDSEERLFLEIDYACSGEFTILPQVIFKNDSETKYSASSLAPLVSFGEKALNILKQNNVSVISKNKNSCPASFLISNYVISENKFKSDGTFTLSKPPALGIWLEPLTSKDKDGISYHSRLFQMKDGQIVLKIKDNSKIEYYLERLRKSLPEVADMEAGVVSKKFERPVIGSSSMWSGECDRAIAKIGFNLLIHNMGSIFASHPCFDDVKSSILTGNPKLPCSLGDGKNIVEVLENPPSDSHVIMMASGTSQDGGIYLVVLFRFYGMGTQTVFLARDNVPHHIETMIYTVRYNEHKISESTLSDYLIANYDLVSNAFLPRNE